MPRVSAPLHNERPFFRLGTDPALAANGPRRVQAEILDRLPPDSSAALASRRDLRVINRLQGNAAWFRRALRRHARPRESVLEIGAGSGELGRSLEAKGAKIAGLDLVPRPVAWPARSPWFETDVRKFAHWASYPVVLGNLFFHHFDHSGLAYLGSQFSRHARLIIASEPLRRTRTAALFRVICPVIQAHPVTRHDGDVSITAGFHSEELPGLLELSPTVWRWQVQETWRGAFRMIAERRP